MNIILEGIKVKQYDEIVRDLEMPQPDAKSKKLLSKEEEEAKEHYELLKEKREVAFCGQDGIDVSGSI